MDTISANETIERISTANYEDETKKDSKKSQLKSSEIIMSLRFTGVCVS